MYSTVHAVSLLICDTSLYSTVHAVSLSICDTSFYNRVHVVSLLICDTSFYNRVHAVSLLICDTSFYSTVHAVSLLICDTSFYNRVHAVSALICGTSCSLCFKPFPPDRGYVRGSRVITLFMSYLVTWFCLLPCKWRVPSRVFGVIFQQVLSRFSSGFLHFVSEKL